MGLVKLSNHRTIDALSVFLFHESAEALRVDTKCLENEDVSATIIAYTE